jgi:hypothetical protein
VAVELAVQAEQAEVLMEDHHYQLAEKAEKAELAEPEDTLPCHKPVTAELAEMAELAEATLEPV